MGVQVLSTPSPPQSTRDPYFYGWRMVPRKMPDGTQTVEQVPLTEWDVLHPQEDDFIGQNDAHNDICNYLKNVFRWRLAGRSGAVVLQDHRVDWQVTGVLPHGPDVVVLFDAPPWNRLRATYKVKDQGSRPLLVVEVTSPTTRNKDLDEKVADYYRAGIPLYAIVDLREGELGPEMRLLAYRPSPEGPVRVLSPEPNRIWLPDLNLWLAAEGDQVTCLERDGTPIGDYLTMAQLAQEAEAEREAERQRADAEMQRAETAESQRDAEKARADDNARKLAELEAELKRLRGDAN